MSRSSMQTPGVSRAARTRARVAMGLITALLTGLGYKAYGLQVESGARFRAQALRQHVRTVAIPAPRGAILDVRGRPLAISADAESVWADPRAVVDLAGTAAKLAGALAVDVNQIEARLAAGKRFAWIARHIAPEQAAAVRALDLPGVEVTHEPRRWYPERSSGGPIVGFAGVDGKGLDGLELALDKELTGRQATFAALRDARGKTMMADGAADPIPGATVELTIDRSIQHLADTALAEAVTLNKAKAGTAVVIDVRTGGVLAMASVPTYDPNDPAAAIAAAARNRGVTDAFEIGSVMKLFTIGGALDAGVIRPGDSFDVEGGSWAAPGKIVRDVHHDQVLTVGGIIKRSSNIGSAKIGLRLGRQRLYEALKRYGFGAATKIELPGEQPGRMRDGSRWREVELVTISYGYGLTVTPLQVAAGLAMIGNGGVYHAPRIVERITGADGRVVYTRPAEGVPAMKPATAAALLPMLASTFEGGKNSGTAASVQVPGFRAGGKTGTAHKLDPVTKRYAPDRYLSSFAGLVPIAAPRLAIVVVIDEPAAGAHYGGKVAGPVFGQIASGALRYLGVPGDAPIDPPKPGAATAAPASARAASAPVAADDVDDDVVDSAAEEALLDPDAPMVEVPSFRGLGVARAIELARARGLEVTVRGAGRCVGQRPGPGTAAPGSTVTLEFEP